jgi:flavin-dependent dehydrogenase
MAKQDAQHGGTKSKVDVLVLGDHPATYLCAALLRQNSKLRIMHSTLPGEKSADRACLLNPAFFSLHKLLEPLKRKLELTPIYGIQFVADEPQTSSTFRSKSTAVYSVCYKDMRSALAKIAAHEQVELITPKHLQIQRLDESGVDVSIGKTKLRARMLVVGGELPPEQQKLLGIPETRGVEVINRYSFLWLKGAKWLQPTNRPVMSMSLDLDHQLLWAWMMPFHGGVQLAVNQPMDVVQQMDGRHLLQHWAQTLRIHGVLNTDGALPMRAVESIDLPLAAALAHEGVANRTLLIGPAGGFYSATGEDLYPNCWSAIHAADVIHHALREKHLQDALQAYRQRWRITLGNYLRGPQQNLRFLLPLVYRNQVMTSRLAESILLGKAMVR